jgi:hypothetical protein
MAIKYAENTSYGTTSPANYSSLIKTLKAKSLERLSKMSAPNAVKEPSEVSRAPLSSGLSPEDKKLQSEAIQAYVNSGVPVSNYMGGDLPPETTLAQYPKVTGVPYGTIVDPATANKPYLTTAKYLSPSEVTPAATFKTLTRGGTFLAEPSKPGQ